MGFAKLFKFGKKGAKMASKKGGKKSEAGFTWPRGIRVGVYGHANSGKTVYFTVLNEDCKVARNLQISVTDNATAGEFLSNYKKIWGVGTATGVGTVVDLREERRFPDPGSVDKLLQFTAILDGSKKIPVVSYDYPGDAIAISEPNEYSEKVADFMDGCDGLLFFFDPKVLKAELQCQAHVASFVNMLERLAPLHRRLPIPVALVVTKADILDGFTGEDQMILVSSEDEPIVCEPYEAFLEKVLGTAKVAGDPAWSGSVRELLVKMKEFVKVVVGRTLDFQIFFVSHTGQEPQKVGAEVGRSVYTPPEKMRPVGVREPMRWLLNAIVRNRRLATMRRLTRYVALAVLAWAVVCSGVYLFHFSLQLGRTTSVEDDILKRYNYDIYGPDAEETRSIKQAYSRYEARWLVNKLFPKFKTPARQLKAAWSNRGQDTRERALENALQHFENIVSNPGFWPSFDPNDAALTETGEYLQLVNELKKYQGVDSSSALFQRSARALTYWGLFKQCVADPSDTALWSRLNDMIAYHESQFGHQRSNGERSLCATLQSAAQENRVAVVQAGSSAQAVDILGTKVSEINSNPSPEYRLETAVEELLAIKGSLNAATNAAEIARIDRYNSDARQWAQERTYTYKIEAMPQDAHLHVEVTAEGGSPSWSVQDQLWDGTDYKLIWQPGRTIHLALDKVDHDCTFGKTASTRKVLTGRYSLFDMEGEITLNDGTTITISFLPGLKKRLPKLKQ